ncbi:MAG: hypothetical protein GX647_06065 [Clostridiales bacterium]|jgi:hypothetical protein|nr:hypothetical protein [Clostridiales bacterium]OPZ69781.1 MAG: hypothetical protein BWY81_00272 [Firmicutes bacterium ADurb.Bin467]
MRWWNKFLNGLKTLALRPEGGVRAPWKLLLAYILYGLWAYAATALPVRGLVHGRIISLIGSLGAVALSHALIFWYAKKRPARLSWKPLGVGTLLGALSVAVGAVLFLAMDSMRPMEKAPSPSWDLLWMLPVYGLASLAEERFARTLALGTASRPVWGYAASSAMFLAVTGGWALGYVGALNMLLTGLVCARWSARGRAGASVGFRFAWSYASGVLLAFPGGSTGARPLISLYSVSENWLTGGEGGLIRGAWMTLVLLLVGAWLFRRRRGSA